MPLASNDPNIVVGFALLILLKTIDVGEGSLKMVVSPDPILKLFHCKTALREVVICNVFPCCDEWAAPETTVMPEGLA
jgi:hypothetical protein